MNGLLQKMDSNKDPSINLNGSVHSDIHSNDMWRKRDDKFTRGNV